MENNKKTFEAFDGKVICYRDWVPENPKAGM